MKNIGRLFMNYSLAIDTSTKNLLYKVWDENHCPISLDIEFDSEKNILNLPKILLTLQKYHINWEDISSILIGIGPGNFSGIRIGIAFVKALSIQSNITCYGIPTGLSFLPKENGNYVTIFSGGYKDFLISYFEQKNGVIVNHTHKLIPRNEIYKLKADYYFSYLEPTEIDLPSNVLSQCDMDLLNWERFKQKEFLFSNEILYVRSFSS